MSLPRRLVRIGRDANSPWNRHRTFVIRPADPIEKTLPCPSVTDEAPTGAPSNVGDAKTVNDNFLEQIQRIANDMQNKVGEAIRNSPAQEIEKNVRAMMNQGFQKMDLVTREEFELQTKVLAKTREKLEALEAKVAALEKSQ